MTIRRPAQLAQFKARSHERLVFQLVGRHCVARPIGQLIARVNIFARPISEANLWLQFCRRTCGWDKFNWAKGAKETVGKGDNIQLGDRRKDDVLSSEKEMDNMVASDTTASTSQTATYERVTLR